MNILTVDNVTYDLNAVPNEVDDLQYCVLDCTNPKSLDYFYIPLIFLESFNAPAVILDIGGQQIEMPMDWSILTSDEDFDGIEVMPLASLNNRGFVAPILNPMKSWMPRSEGTHTMREHRLSLWPTSGIGSPGIRIRRP